MPPNSLSMKPESKKYLSDIEYAIGLIEEFLVDFTFPEYQDDLKTKSAVERQLGIMRELTEIDGMEAVRLWWRYVNHTDQGALNTLLEYNKEDVLNLRVLKNMLT